MEIDNAEIDIQRPESTSGSSDGRGGSTHNTDPPVFEIEVTPQTPLLIPTRTESKETDEMPEDAKRNKSFCFYMLYLHFSVGSL